MEDTKAALLRREVTKAEVVLGLRHAVDLTYRRFVEAARADWERLIGSDPADACVKVRVHASTFSATRFSNREDRFRSRTRRVQCRVSRTDRAYLSIFSASRRVPTVKRFAGRSRVATNF
jgi:hypothetical protein